MTIKDIARAAGVSTSTVSKVINQKDASISEETRQRVLQVIEESNYMPYAGVRDRLLARNNQIALVVPTLQDPFLSEFAAELQTYARSRGYVLSILLSGADASDEGAILAELSDAYVAGLLFFPQHVDSLTFLEKEDNHIANMVLLDCNIPNLQYPQVSRDFLGAAETSTSYLLKYDHRRIALVLRAESAVSIRDQLLAGYQSALSQARMSFDPLLVHTPVSDSGHTLDRMLGNLIDTGIDAVLCQDSRLVGEMYRLILKKQYPIPENISVISLEDSAILEQLHPAVTSIRTSPQDMARLACDALLAQMNGGQSAAFRATLPQELIRRDSVKKHVSPKHKIVIAGSINMDVTLKIPTLPHSGETVLASDQSSWPGGKGANQAIGVSRFGGDAFMIGRLGNDIYGKQLYERLSREQVDMRGVSFSPEQPSGTAYINVQEDGQNTIVVIPGANASVTPAYVEENLALFTDARYCLIQMEIPLETVEAIIQICKAAGVRVILKPSPVQALSDSMLDGLFLLVPNQEEMARLVTSYPTPLDQAQEMLRHGVENVIVTLGENGCLFVNRDIAVSYPAMDFPSIDTTGASDIFISCLAAQLSMGHEMETAIRLSSIAASYSVSREGVQNAIISNDLLMDLYHGDYTLSH